MSKIGKQPITIPNGVTVVVGATEVAVRAVSGELHLPILRGITVSETDGTLNVSLAGTGKQARANWGTMRALLANTIRGLEKPFEKTLILEGVGLRIAKEGGDLVLSLGFSHPVRYAAVPGVSFEVEKNSSLTVRGADRALVGQVAADIRSLKKPEPYKGKGFRYAGEVIRRKAGKKAATGAAK